MRPMITFSVNDRSVYEKKIKEKLSDIIVKVIRGERVTGGEFRYFFHYSTEVRLSDCESLVRNKTQIIDRNFLQTVKEKIHKKFSEINIRGASPAVLEEAQLLHRIFSLAPHISLHDCPASPFSNCRRIISITLEFASP